VSIALPAIVLTAGLGTRLDPLTRLVAKPAVPVGESTLIELVLAWLRSAGISEAVLNLHHRPETLTGLLGDGSPLDLRVRYSWEDPVLGSAGGPARAIPLLETRRVLIVNGDTLCPVDLQELLDAHERSRARVTLAVVQNPAPLRYTGLVLDDEDRVVRRELRGTPGPSTWHFVGVQIAESDVFDSVSTSSPADTIPGLYLDMAREDPGSVRAWRTDVPFLDVGTPVDYLHAALARSRAHAAAPGLVRTIVWPDARVAPDVQLEECIVAGPVTVPAGFSARRAVLLPAAVARSDEAAHVNGAVAVFPF
jgi:NDP-sugar pyrophosphorylase family protein